MKNRTGFICGHRLRRSLSSGHARTNINPPDANIYTRNEYNIITEHTAYVLRTKQKA